MPKTILIIDDSPVLRALTKRALTDAGFATVEATDGQDAQARVGGVDAVLCDVHMPRLNGLDFLRWLRGNSATRRLPLVFLTTDGHDEYRQVGRVLGASAWIKKPVAPETLVRVMRGVCATQ